MPTFDPPTRVSLGAPRSALSHGIRINMEAR